MLITSYRVISDQGDRLRAYTRAVLASEPEVVPDVAVGLRRLCRAAITELGLDRVSVTLMGQDGSYTVVAAAPEDGVVVEELQFDLGEGPGLQAHAERRPVLVADLSTRLGRWPAFAPTAMEQGVVGVFAFPLQLGAVRFGVLTCLSRTARSLGSDELSACVIFAEVATELLLDSSPTGPDPDLRASLHVNDHVYQAQGMVTVDLGVALDVALTRMRAVAYAEGTTLDALAAEIVAGRRLESDPRAEEP